MPVPQMSIVSKVLGCCVTL